MHGEITDMRCKTSVKDLIYEVNSQKGLGAPLGEPKKVQENPIPPPSPPHSCSAFPYMQ